MSYACCSGSSSEALPSAALIPPSAAPEWLRVGWIFETRATSAPASNENWLCSCDWKKLCSLWPLAWAINEPSSRMLFSVRPIACSCRSSPFWSRSSFWKSSCLVIPR